MIPLSYYFVNISIQDTNKKSFNAYLRSKTKAKSNINPLKVNGNVKADSSSMATILNDYFASVFTRDHDDIIPDIPNQQFYMS